ncbi:MAG: NAD(P)-dependent oxidoreductase, partial [Patescibacteria group bacterium]
MKVFITRKIPEIGIKLLQEKGYDVVVSSFDGVLPREELIQSVKGVDAILSLLTDKIDGEVMDAAGPQLKIAANYAVGYDNISIEDAKKRGIFATNTPDVLTDTVAEHTFALMISIAHRVAEGDKFMRAGRYKGWEPMLLLGTDMMKKTLGVIGLGRIGGRVAYIGARGFDMKIVYYDVKRSE